MKKLFYSTVLLFTLIFLAGGAEVVQQAGQAGAGVGSSIVKSFEQFSFKAGPTPFDKGGTGVLVIFDEPSGRQIPVPTVSPAPPPQKLSLQKLRDQAAKDIVDDENPFVQLHKDARNKPDLNKVKQLDDAGVKALPQGAGLGRALNAPITPMEQQMLDKINAERARRGLPPYQLDPTLTAMARAYNAKNIDLINRGIAPFKGYHATEMSLPGPPLEIVANFDSPLEQNPGARLVDIWLDPAHPTGHAVSVLHPYATSVGVSVEQISPTRWIGRAIPEPGGVAPGNIPIQIPSSQLVNGHFLPSRQPPLFR